jgi:hypothetical protein
VLQPASQERRGICIPPGTRESGCDCGEAQQERGPFLVSYSWSDNRAAKVWEVASRECVRTISDGLPNYATSAQLLAAAGLSAPPVGAQVNVDDDAILLTPQGGISATRLGMLGTPESAMFGCLANRAASSGSASNPAVRSGSSSSSKIGLEGRFWFCHVHRVPAVKRRGRHLNRCLPFHLPYPAYD